MASCKTKEQATNKQVSTLPSRLGDLLLLTAMARTPNRIDHGTGDVQGRIETLKRLTMLLGGFSSKNIGAFGWT